MKIKVGMHVHSLWSYDGQWPLERIVASFSKRGYQVLLMTEHDQGFSEERRQEYWAACRRASTDQMLLVPGIEYSDPSNTIHLLVWGDIPFLGTGQKTMAILEAVTEHGGVCVFAHPSRRSAWKLFHPDWLKHLTGIEIWNRKTDGWAVSSRAKNLIAKTKAPQLVGLDFHSPKQFFPLALSVEINGRPEQQKILTALRAGRFQSEAFGRDVRIFTRGLPGSAMRVLELLRRSAAKSVRLGISSWAWIKASVPSRGKREAPTR